jgi:hypothetical protein
MKIEWTRYDVKDIIAKAYGGTFRDLIINRKTNAIKAKYNTAKKHCANLMFFPRFVA